LGQAWFFSFGLLNLRRSGAHKRITTGLMMEAATDDLPREEYFDAMGINRTEVDQALTKTVNLPDRGQGKYRARRMGATIYQPLPRSNVFARQRPASHRGLALLIASAASRWPADP
jgi:hypothetical protein